MRRSIALHIVDGGTDDEPSVGRLAATTLAVVGSGLKFKKCCLPKVEPCSPGARNIFGVQRWDGVEGIHLLELREKGDAVCLKKSNARKRDRVARYGHIRPQMSVVPPQGQRMVTVRNRIYYSDKWKFFPDFLRDYVPQILGLDWCKAEAAKPEAERHPIITLERRRPKPT